MKDNFLYNSNSNIGSEGGGEGRERELNIAEGLMLAGS